MTPARGVSAVGSAATLRLVGGGRFTAAMCWKCRRDRGPVPRVRLDGEVSAEQLDSLAHAGEPEALTQRRRVEDVADTGGRLELGSTLPGSVSRALMTGAPCPVVVVPPDALLPKRSRTNAIVCGVEGGERDRAVLRFAGDLRRRLDGTLHAVHGFDPSPGPWVPALVIVGGHGDGRLAATARCPVAVLPPSAELAPGSGHYELTAGAA
jgi:hypothetical protein